MKKRTAKPPWYDRGALMRYVVTPLIGAFLVGCAFGGFILFEGLTGFRGRGHSREAPLPFDEAWKDVPILSQLVFVVALLVLEVRALAFLDRRAPLKQKAGLKTRLYAVGRTKVLPYES